MAKKYEIDISVNDKQAVKATDNLAKGFDKVDNIVNDTNEAVGGLTDSLDKMSGGAISGFKGLVSGARAGVAAMTSLKFAIAATGIGALLIAVTSITQYFTKTERGAQKLREIMAGLGAAVDVIVDASIILGETLVGIFENPKKALSDFGNLLKQNIINRFEGLMELIPALGKSISLLFKGEFSEAGKVAFDAAAKVGLGVENITDKIIDLAESAVEGIKNITAEIQNEVSAAIALEKALNAVKVRERELRVARAEANAEIEKQKFIAEDVTKTFEEREAATRKAFELEQSLTKAQVENERERLRILQAKAALGESDEATLEAVADQRVRVAEIEATSATKQIELNNKLNGLAREKAAIADAARIKAEEDRIAAEEQKQAEILEVEQELLTEQEREVQAVQSKYERLKALAEQHGQDVEAIEANKIAALEGIDSKYAEFQKALSEAEVNRKKVEAGAALNIVAGALGTAAGLAAEGSGFAKALSITATTIQTYQAAMAAYSSAAAIPVVGAVLGPLAAAAAIAVGVANVSKIASSKTPQVPSGLSKGARGGSGGASASAPRPTAPITPQFNITGGNNQLSQINESINSNNQKPVKTYVVGDDVSSQQELDRKIESNATL